MSPSAGLSSASATSSTASAAASSVASRRPRRGALGGGALGALLELGRDARERLGERVGEVAEDVGRVVELDQLVGRRRARATRRSLSSGQDLGPEAAGRAEHEPLVVVVHDDQVAEAVRSAARTPPRTGRAGCASLCWLRSWKSSARLYSASAAPSSSSASSTARLAGGPGVGGARVGRPCPRARTSPRARRRPWPAGRRSRWARPGQARRPRGRPRRTRRRSRPGCRAPRAPTAFSTTSVSRRPLAGVGSSYRLRTRNVMSGAIER